MQAAELESWPGISHRRPKRSSVTFAVRRHLSRWIESEAQRAGAELGSFRVLDVGCAKKPYYPYFAPFAAEYVGTDIDPNNDSADLYGPVENLPVEDGSFEVVVCTQVLEHSPDPDRAVQELWRVCAPGGRVLASTHGVQVYHPAPEDYWRWTHVGLGLLFSRNGEWQSITVQPAGGTATCLATMTGVYVDLLFRRVHLTLLGRGLVWILNTTGSTLDRRIPSLREPQPGSVFLNYHVVAVKPL